MFKKGVKVSAQNQLSGKDKKTIKSKLCDNLNQGCVQKLLTMNDKIICCKISGSKMLIYQGDQYPLFVDGTGKHNYFPSLYVAAAYQPLMKTLVLNQGVQTYIYNGANLMWPGVRSFENLGEFQKDQVVGIRNSKGQIIAIGAMGISKKQLTDTSGVAVYILHYHGDKLWEMGSKAYPEVIVPLPVAEVKKQQPKVQQTKAQEPKVQQKQQDKKDTVKQDKKDTVKQDKKKQQPKDNKQNKKQKTPQPSPPKKQKTPQQSQQSDDDVDLMSLVHNKGQSKGHVIQMQKKGNLKNAFVEDQNQQQNKKNKKKGGQSQPPGKKGKKKQQSEEQDQAEVMQEQQKPKQKDNKKGGKKKPQQKQKGSKKNKKDQSQQQEQKQQKQQKSDQQQQGKTQQKSAINTKLMDSYFKQSMLNAIKLSKIEAELPVDSGKFFMDYMIAARPQGVKLQIKDSSYKKIGKFFEEMNKKKIIQYKHPKDKKAQGAQITKIFWQNEQVKNHVPTVKKLASKQEEQKVQSYSKAKLKLSKTVALQTVYKPNQQLFDNVFKKPLNLMPDHSDEQVTDKQQIQYVTEKDLREKIEKYINKISQTNKDKQAKQKDVKKVQKTDKLLLVDYNKHAFVKNLLKKQIQQFQENKQKDDILKQDQASDDQGDKKKKKNKKGTGGQGLFKVERNYLVDKMMAKAMPYHHVFDKQTGLDRFKQGQFKGIQLVAEKSNNKNVTKISGLQLFIVPKQEADDQIHGFANALQLKFACSVNVQNLPGKGAGKQIIVHGAFLDELEEIFTQEHQLPNKFITTQNKLDKKKKN